MNRYNYQLALNLYVPKLQVKFCFDIHTSFGARVYIKFGKVLLTNKTINISKNKIFSIFTFKDFCKP